jgi:predicted acyl esterase
MPGPAIGYLQECLRWFDHWMRGADNGIMDEPKVHAWMAEDVPAKAFYPQSPGRWAAESNWPSSNIVPKVLYLHDTKLTCENAEGQPTTVTTPQTLGLEAGELMPWFLHGPAAELPGDQRADDGKSMCFNTEPLSERLEILGAPELELELEVDQPTAFLAVRLCDVAPSGASKRVTYAILNLTHREGAEHPRPLEPGKRFKLKVPLIETGYVFLPGHRLRVALSTTYWPLIWPSPRPVSLTIQPGSNVLTLPVRVGDEVSPVLFEEAEAAAPLARIQQKPGGRKRTIHTDPLKGEIVIEITDNAGRYRMDDIDWEVESFSTERYRIVEDDPLSASAEVRWTWIFQRGDWRVSTETWTRLTCSEEHFHLSATVDAFEGGGRIFSRNFNETIKRQGN